MFRRTVWVGSIAHNRGSWGILKTHADPIRLSPGTGGICPALTGIGAGRTVGQRKLHAQLRGDHTVKIALAQINTTVGDMQGNATRAADAIERAAKQGAELVLLPELTISGYPPQDLVERPAFLEANERALRETARAARGVYAVVGHAGASRIEAGKLAANCASLVRDGEVLARREKTLLPTYDVFDEARHFQPAVRNLPVQAGGTTVGLTICEDAWNDPEFWEQRRYETDPMAVLAAAGVDFIVNISASPFSAGKQQFRQSMLSNSARRHGLPLFYVNLVGGNDQLIFDGGSLAIDSAGRTIAEGARFEEDLVLVDSLDRGTAQRSAPAAEPEQTWRALVLGLRDYAHKCGFSAAVLALSGGIDSAVTAAVAADALGPENVTPLFLPSRFSSRQSRRDAEAVAANLGLKLHVLSIESLRARAGEVLEPLFRDTEPGVAEENIQARLRGMLVMAYANKFGALPLATGNKSELAVGYCTLYGDMVGGLAVIGDVPKTLVYELARYVNRTGQVIPDSVLNKPPSAELKPDQKDEDALPPYEILDGILDLYIHQNVELEEIVSRGYDRALAAEVLRMVDAAEFKRRQAPITLRVTTKAFGWGRRLPVAQKWRAGETPS